MVQSTEHRHMSIRGLALHAQRIGKVVAHPATWGKLIRERAGDGPGFDYIRPSRRLDSAPMPRTSLVTSTVRWIQGEIAASAIESRSLLNV